ncbi:secretin N-terminal domain-containing protein [Trinickia sp. NRRL B-1857]|uniref:secretin N-terminal domain-containing protein n=1 Tax=Trinickia sp. NRRL B-1857 TaxID=3162879 RepID=UPI003D284565
MFARVCLRLPLLAALVLLTASGSALAGAEVSASLAAPYAVEASQQTIVTVLERFAADHGLTIRIAADTKMSGDWKTAKLDGWMRAPTGRAFLEQLSHAHHFSWFVAERTLYLSAANDAAVQRVELGGMPADRARAALEEVGIYDARFGWGELSGQDAVLVGGPSAYRAIVRRFMTNQARTGEPSAEQEPMIFPLRFARAVDAAPTHTGAAVGAGAATLLRQLLAPEPPAAQPRFALPAQTDLPPLPNAPSPVSPIGAWTGFAAAMPSSPLPASLTHTSRGALSDAAEIRIVADEGTNSVIVWADRRWRSRIAQIIDALDRPSSLVSMDVFVIETDLATVAALDAASHGGREAAAPSFDEAIATALADRRARLLNRQTLVGRFNSHSTLAIGGEASQTATAPDQAVSEQRNGRSGNDGDRLDLAARLVPSIGAAAPAVVVDIDLLMAQPTGLPGQTWANTSSVKLDTAVTLESGAPPRLVASYPVASARAEQRAIFIGAKAL